MVIWTVLTVEEVYAQLPDVSVTSVGMAMARNAKVTKLQNICK